MDQSTAVPAELLNQGLVLVTGAGGFLGLNAVWALREQGLRVRALLHCFPPPNGWNGTPGYNAIAF